MSQNNSRGRGSNRRGRGKPSQSSNRGAKQQTVNRRQPKSSFQKEKKKKNVFIPPDSTPVDKMKISIVNEATELTEQIDAFSTIWTKSLKFLPFYPPDNQTNQESDKILQVISEDLKELLSYEYHVFWSYLAFENSLKLFIDTFLRYFKSPGSTGSEEDEFAFGNNQQPNTHSRTPGFKYKREIFERVWRVLYRMSQFQEDKKHWISPNIYTQYVFKRGFFNIPQLIDICVHYGPYLRKDVITLVKFCFDNNRSFLVKDLSRTYQQIENVLDECSNNIYNLWKSGETQQASIIEDTINYMFDIFLRLTTFLDLSPKLVTFEVEHFTEFRSLLIYIYEVTLRLLGELAERHGLSLRRLQNTKVCLINLFMIVLRTCYIVPLTQTQTEEHSQNFTSELGQAKLFLILLQEFPFISKEIAASKGQKTETMEVFQQGTLLNELENQLHLRESLNSLLICLPSLDQKTVMQTLQILDNYCTQVEKTQLQNVKVKVEHYQFTNPPAVTSTSSPISKERMEKISKVKEVLEYLGEGFIDKCLDLYKDDVATVMDRILTENLAEPLLDIDRQLPLPTQQLQSTIEVTSSAKNYNSQQVNNPIPVDSKGLASFHTGKSNKSFLRNAEELQFAKEFTKDFHNRDLYDDEYDDSMDQYVPFGMVGDETKDETVTLTASGNMIIDIEDDDTESTKEPEVTKETSKNAVTRSKNTNRSRGQGQSRGRGRGKVKNKSQQRE